MNEQEVQSERQLREHEYELKGGIKESPEFERKGLARYTVNVGTACGHQCLYCSTRSVLWRHPSFKAFDERPMGLGYAITDTGIVDRVRIDVKRHEGQRGRVIVCSYSDAWAPQPQRHNLGPQIVEAILAEPGWTVRVLTKNVAVEGCLDLLRENRDRVSLGLTTTGLPEHDGIFRVIEPFASPMSERYRLLERAHGMGIPTYAMLCPLFPGLFDTQESIDRLLQEALRFGPTEIFAENLNKRGNNIELIAQGLRANGLGDLANSVESLRDKTVASQFVRDLTLRLLDAANRLYDINRFRLMMYPDNLLPAHKAELERMQGIVWLGKTDTCNSTEAQLASTNIQERNLS